jgi:hypothetical protein
MWQSSLLALTLVLSSTLALRAEEKLNPQYASWAKFKPGTRIAQISSSTTNGVRTDTKITWELLKVADTKLTLQGSQEVTFNGKALPNLPPTKFEVKKMVESNPKSGPIPINEVTEGVDRTVTDEGKQDVTIDGKSYSCQVELVTTKFSGDITTYRSWKSEEIPGGLFKAETKSNGSDLVLETLKIEIK